MKYPCIVYNLSDIVIQHADDAPYFKKNQYDLTLITEDPEPSTLDLLTDLPLTSFDRWFATNDLNHFALTTHF